MKDIHEILKSYWGFDQFRPGQEEIIAAVLEGNDVLALLPTGGGKSLCYQVPVMMKPGLGLVISPLIALMKDQVEGLRKKGITAYAVYSGMSRKELIQVLKVATESNCKFLFVSPERLETKIFQEYLPGLAINLLAIDESHCISQWGYDFRPSYLKIAAIREYLGPVPVLALTASATEEVQKDICEKLNRAAPFDRSRKEANWKIFRQSFARPGLSYSVFSLDSKINKIIEVIEKVNGSSIVYCRSRKRTKETADLLRMNNISAAHYHAGLPAEERTKKQEDWISNKTRVIVCTNAFGMGIDKPDVRTVIHADIPDCLESYYQEAGRAGRDGKRSYAVLLTEQRDLDELSNLSTARFPAVAEIRTVYQALANYLQVPSGSGQGEYYDFDFGDFLKKFKLTGSAVMNVLKVLEQEGWISFNEQVFIPSMLQFTCSKESIYQAEKEHKELEPLIKTLLRSYEGIFDQPVYISEKMIAGLLRSDLEGTRIKLHFMHQAGLVDYRPQKDKPQLYFLRARVKAGDLHIDLTEYHKRKEIFEKRVETMIRYVKNETECRSRIIGNYFGDHELGDCGICDNCLRKKNKPMNKMEFEKIQAQITETLKQQPLHINQLDTMISSSRKENTWAVLAFMHSENLILMDEQGNISLGSK